MTLSLLGFNSLRDVLVVTHPLCAHGYNFAILLGLPPDTVDFIKQDHTCSVDFLTQVLTHWLKKNYDTQKYGVPSWRLLCAAAASPIGGANPALAEKIASDHKNGRCLDNEIND